MSHVDDERLHNFLDGALPGGDEARAAMEAHLHACPDCRARLDAAREDREGAREILALLSPDEVRIPPFDEILARRAAREIGRPKPDARPRRRRFLVPLAWAASIMVAIAGGWLARGAFRPPPAEQVAASYPAGPGQADAVQPERRAARQRQDADRLAAVDLPEPPESELAGPQEEQTLAEAARRAGEPRTAGDADGRPAAAARQTTEPRTADGADDRPAGAADRTAIDAAERARREIEPRAERARTDPFAAVDTTRMAVLPDSLRFEPRLRQGETISPARPTLTGQRQAGGEVPALLGRTEAARRGPGLALEALTVAPMALDPIVRALRAAETQATAAEGWAAASPAEANHRLGRRPLGLEGLPWEQMEVAEVDGDVLLRTVHPLRDGTRVVLVQASWATGKFDLPDSRAAFDFEPAAGRLARDGLAAVIHGLEDRQALVELLERVR